MESRLKGFLLFSSIIHPSKYQKNLKANRVLQNCFLFFSGSKIKPTHSQYFHHTSYKNTVKNWEKLLSWWKTIRIACGFQQFCNFPFTASKNHPNLVYLNRLLPCLTCKTKHFLMPVAFKDDSSKHIRCQSLRDL